MNTKIYGLMIIVIAFIIGGYYTFRSTTTVLSVKIALLVPAVHPSMDAIEKGLLTTLKKTMPEAHVDVYNANGNKVLLKGQVEKIVNGSYDMCCAVGSNASTSMVTTLEKYHKTMPLLAISIYKNVAQELYQKYPYVTAITDYDYDFIEKRIELIMKLKDVKHPVIVYDGSSNAHFEQDIKDYKKVFEKYGITLSSIPVYSLQEVYQKLVGTISAYDLVITFTDHTICSAMDALVKLCNQHGITLYTAELDSNDKGAAVSFGVQEKDYGVLAADMISDIYANNVIVPFRKNGPYYLKINRKAAELQNLILPSNIQPLSDIQVIEKDA